MLKYLQQFVNNLNKPKNYLILANFLLVILLILVSNLGMLSMKLSDFAFISAILLVFALYRPGWSFLIFVGTIVLENINLAPKGIGIAIRPFQFFGAITTVAILGRMIIRKSNIKFTKLKWFDYVMIVFAIAGFVSMLFSANKGLVLKQNLVLVSFLVLYFLVRTFIQNLEDVKKIMPFFLSSSVIVVLYGIFQNIRFMRGLNPFETMPGRPNSTFTESDWLGIFLVLLIAIIYSIIYFIEKNKKDNLQIQEISVSEFLIAQDSFSPQSKKRLAKISLYLLLAASFVLLILTVSRSAWLGAGFVTLIFLKATLTDFSIKFKSWNWRQFLFTLQFLAYASICSIGLVYVFHLTNFQLFNRAQSTGTGMQQITVACEQASTLPILPQKIENVSELEKYDCRHINLEDIEKEKTEGHFVSTIFRPDPNVSIRSQIYQKSIEQIKKHPIFGIGWGNISKILGSDERGAGLNASNIFLEIWLGSGIIGLLAFLTIWIYIFILSLKRILKNDPESKVVGMFMMLGFFAFLIPNLFNSGIFLGILWVWLGIVLSLKSNKN
jgi:hypothetical protein